MSERTFYERPETIGDFSYIRLKSGRLTTYWEQSEAADRAHTNMIRAVSRSIKLASVEKDPEIRDYKLERIDWFIDHLELYVAAVRAHLDEKRGNITKRERIALLRNVKGRTPEEAEAFLRKADELEARED